MKKYEFLYKSLVVVVATVFVLVLANVAFADTVAPNFTSVSVDGELTAGGTIDAEGGLELGSMAYTAGAGQIRAASFIISGSYIRATSYIEGSYLKTNTWYPRTGSTIAIAPTATTLNATNTDFNVGDLDAGNLYADDISALSFSSATSETSLIQAGMIDVNSDHGAYMDGSLTAESLNVTGSTDLDGTVYIGDEITLNPTYGSVHADEIGSFYTEADYCDSIDCIGSFYFNVLEVFCNPGDVVVACEAYAYEGSNRADVAFGAYPYGDTYPSVVSWSPSWDSCVGRADDDDAGLYVQALCFDPEGLTSGGYSDPSQYYYFR